MDGEEIRMTLTIEWLTIWPGLTVATPSRLAQATRLDAEGNR